MTNMNSTIPTLALSEDFFESFATLPLQIRKGVSSFLEKFRRNPTSKGVHYEALENPTNPDFRSARINDDYRVIIQHPEEGNVFVLLFVGKHDDAYKWAQTHQCRFNPRTSAVQVFEVFKSPSGMGTTTGITTKPDETSLKENKKTNPKEKKKQLISVDDETLLKMGVPNELLFLVRRIETFEELKSLRKIFPPDAFDSLCALAQGNSVEEVSDLFVEKQGVSKGEQTITEAFTNPNQRTLRGFKIIEPDEFLKKISEESLQAWRIFLHPTQRKLVERKSQTPMLVRGVAGTGKTVVALYRARHLAMQIPEDSSKTVLLTTFTKNLAEDLSSQLDLICEEELRKKIEVVNIDAWVSDFLKTNNSTETIVFPGSERENIYQKSWELALAVKDDSVDFSNDFYDSEWRRVILAQNIRTEAQYLHAPRKGRGKAITREQRKLIWPVFEEMRNNLQRYRAMTIEDACSAAITFLKENPGLVNYEAVVVDETQDMSTQALTLLAKLATAPDNEPAIFLVGDSHQRIYNRQASLSSCGINVRGRRSARLKLVYRTTEEIRQLSETVLLGQTVSDMDGGIEEKDSLTSAYGFRHGDKPEIYKAKSLIDQVDWVLNKIRLANCPESEVCIVFRTKALLDDFKEELESRGIRTVTIKRSENTKKEGIRLSTMHRIKGLEFKWLFIADCDDSSLPFAKVMKTEDDKERSLNELSERSLFYVACTRARDKLFISYTGNPSPYIIRLT